MRVGERTHTRVSRGQDAAAPPTTTSNRQALDASTPGSETTDRRARGEPDRERVAGQHAHGDVDLDVRDGVRPRAAEVGDDERHHRGAVVGVEAEAHELLRRSELDAFHPVLLAARARALLRDHAAALADEGEPRHVVHVPVHVDRADVSVAQRGALELAADVAEAAGRPVERRSRAVKRRSPAVAQRELQPVEPAARFPGNLGEVERGELVARHGLELRLGREGDQLGCCRARARVLGARAATEHLRRSHRHDRA